MILRKSLKPVGNFGTARKKVLHFFFDDLISPKQKSIDMISHSISSIFGSCSPISHFVMGQTLTYS